MKDFTLIKNDIFQESQLSIPARYLLCVLTKYCGQKGYCFPSQSTLGKTLGCSDRHIRDLLNELGAAGLVYKTRRGYNRSNTYKVAKEFVVKNDRNAGSYQLGSMFPLHQGSPIPPKSTYLEIKDKSSSKGLERLRKVMEERGLRKSSLLNPC